MNKVKEEFCISVLSNVCESKFDRDEYSIGSPQECSVCIERIADNWGVYEKEKNSKNDLYLFDNIIEACIDFLRRLCRDEEYKEVKSVFLDAIIIRESA